MNRRTFLAALSTTLGAGCLTQSPPPSDDPAARGFVANTNTTTATTATTTTTSNTTATETQTTTDASTTTEETTTTSTVDAQAAEHMTTAENKMHSAIAIYSEFAGTSASFMDVDARTTSFNRAVVASSISDAESALSKAKETATDEQLSTIADLETTTQYLDAIARAQSYATDAYAGLDAALTGLFAADHESAQDGYTKLTNAHQPALDALTASQQYDVATVTAFDGLSSSQVTEKDSQLQAELTAFGQFIPALGHAIDASTNLASCMQKTMVDERDFGTAVDQGKTAETKYADAVDAWSAPSEPTYLSARIDAVDCYLGTMPRAAECYRAAASNAKRQSDYWRKYRDNMAERGMKALKKCDSTHGLRSIY